MLAYLKGPMGKVERGFIRNGSDGIRSNESEMKNKKFRQNVRKKFFPVRKIGRAHV